MFHCNKICTTKFEFDNVYKFVIIHAKKGPSKAGLTLRFPKNLVHVKL